MDLPQIFGILADAATFLGFPVAIFVFLNEKMKERREREDAVYSALDDKFLDFQRLCMDHPELDLYDVPLKDAPVLTSEQKIRQYAMFDILVSLLERAYLMYQDQPGKVKKNQWLGWEDYMRDYAAHPVFQDLWHSRSGQYEKRFLRYMNGMIKQAESENPGVRLPPADGREDVDGVLGG